jgi:hypothetical protein
VTIGTCNALLIGIKTMVDGSVKIEFSINPEDQDVLSKLMKLFLNDKKIVALGMVSIDD